MKTISIVSRRFPKCAFCEHWNDKNNAHIRTVAQNINLWRYNEVAICLCSIHNKETQADYRCSHYSCKIK